MGVTRHCLLILLLLALSACALTGHAIDDQQVLGAILSLTGHTAYVGEWARNGIELAREERGVPVLYEDDACDPRQAVDAYNTLVHVKGVRVIIGPVCSSSVLAVAPLAEEDHVLILTPVATSSDITAAGDYIFRNRETGNLHGIALAELAFKKLGARKAGILFINLDNGRDWQNSFTQRFTALGGTVIASESYEPGTVDFRSQLAKMQDADVLFFAGQRPENAIVQARELGMEQQIIGPTTMKNDEIIDVAGAAAEGVLFVYTTFDPGEAYAMRYRERYGDESEFYAANSFDAYNVLVDAMQACGDETECIRDYLYAIEYDGASGTFSFDENGDATRDLEIWQIKDGAFTPLHPS